MSLFVRSLVILPPSIYLSIINSWSTVYVGTVGLSLCFINFWVGTSLLSDVCPPPPVCNKCPSQFKLICLSPLPPCIYYKKCPRVSVCLSIITFSVPPNICEARKWVGRSPKGACRAKNKGRVAPRNSSITKGPQVPSMVVEY